MRFLADCTASIQVSPPGYTNVPSPINVGFWTTLYETAEDDDRQYHDVLASTESVVERAERLWDWKDLSRGVDFESIRPVVESRPIESYLDRDPADAVETFGHDFVAAGALANPTIVTPVFVLHLADSEHEEYSTRFPIFDARVWTAFVFLTGRRSGTETLPVGATTSTERYGAFVDFFGRTCPDSVDGRIYERALFRFGSYIDSVPAESIDEVGAHLSKLEDAIDQYTGETGTPLLNAEAD